MIRATYVAVLVKLPVGHVEPEHVPPIGVVDPFLNHWYVSGPVEPAVAVTVRVVELPDKISSSAGCWSIVGREHESYVSNLMRDGRGIPLESGVIVSTTAGVPAWLIFDTRPVGE